MTTEPGCAFLDVDGHRLRVDVVGDGPPLLLINGFGVSLEVWAPLRHALSGTRTIAFDAPGVGASSIPRLPVSIRSLAHLVIRLLDELDCKEVDVLGVSLGGAVAQELAHRAPDRVRRLVLCATSCGLGAMPGDPLALALLVNPLRNYSKRYSRWAAPRMLGGRMRTVPGAAGAHVALRNSRPPELRGFLWQLLGMAGWTSLPWLHTVTHPALVLAGDDDLLVPLRNARVLASRLPSARLRVVRGGGHLFLLESLDAAAPVIATFLTHEDAPASDLGRGRSRRER
jgi:poly(3-hydroxyalkanoate) depolymerase